MKKDINNDINDSVKKDNVTENNSEVHVEKASQNEEQSDDEVTGVESGNENDVDENNVEEDELQKCQSALKDYEDKYLRLMAEFENYRKRILKEKTDLILNGGEKVITSILPVLDDIDRAEELMSTDTENTSNEGTHLIFQKLKDTLSKNGLKKMDSVGEVFNVDFHEAIAMVPGLPDDQRGRVIDCIEEGYMLNDKVIRHAKVAVAE